MKVALRHSPAHKKIYAGSVDDQGNWRVRKDVTDLTLLAVIQHMVLDKVTPEFTHSDGKTYQVRIIAKPTEDGEG